MATTVYLRVSTGTFQPRSLSRGHSFEVSKYDGKNEVYPDLIQGQKIKAKTVRHPPAKAGLKGVHRQDCRRQPPTIIALSRQDSYAHTLKGYFYTNLGGTLETLLCAYEFANLNRYPASRRGGSLPRKGR